MVSFPALTIHLFGASCLVAGFHNLLRRRVALATFSVPASALPAINGNSLAAIAMGIYYHLAATQENRAFFALTVPMRLLTAYVFCFASGATTEQTRKAFWLAGVWEASGSLLTAASLVWEWWASGGR